MLCKFNMYLFNNLKEDYNMIRVGGSSYTNGISFVSRKYKVNFETTSDKTKIFLRKNESEKTSSILNSIHKIPFIRGIFALLSINKTLILLLFLDIYQHIVMANSNNESKKYIISSYITLTISIIIFCIMIWYVATKIFKNIKSTWQYHGAEHKVIYTNYEDKELTLGNCRKAPRISDSCGTMLVFLFFFIYFIIRIVDSKFKLNIWSSIHFIISESIAYELFLLDRNTPIIRFIFKLGYAFQKYVVTSEPTDFQLNQAIEAFKLLEEAETGKISENELQELLKNGRQTNVLHKIFQ